MEMLVVMAIMMILFTIGVVAFGKASEKADTASMRAQVQLLHDAISMYEGRWGYFPIEGDDNDLDFISHLSKVSVGDTRWGGSSYDEFTKRPMFIDFDKSGFDFDTNGEESYNDLGEYISNPDYNPPSYHPSHDENKPVDNRKTILKPGTRDGYVVYDPWGNPYKYFLNNAGDSYLVVGIGGEEISDLTASYDDGRWIIKDGSTALTPSQLEKIVTSQNN